MSFEKVRARQTDTPWPYYTKRRPFFSHEEGKGLAFFLFYFYILVCRRGNPTVPVPVPGPGLDKTFNLHDRDDVQKSSTGDLFSGTDGSGFKDGIHFVASGASNPVIIVFVVYPNFGDYLDHICYGF